MLKESGIPLTIGIRNPNSINKESRIQYLESGICGVESRIQDCLGFSYMGRLVSLKVYRIDHWAQLFEGRLALNPGFFFLCSKAFSRIIFSVIFRTSNHQLVDKKN